MHFGKETFIKAHQSSGTTMHGEVNVRSERLAQRDTEVFEE